jgi:hypothetical protein
MKKILSFLTGPWLNIGLIAALAVTAGAVFYQYNAGQRAIAKVEQLTADLAVSEAENAEAQARHARDLIRVANAFDEERARLEAVQDAISAIDQAPDSDDGPVAPVLKDTLRRLP